MKLIIVISLLFLAGCSELMQKNNELVMCIGAVTTNPQFSTDACDMLFDLWKQERNKNG